MKIFVLRVRARAVQLLDYHIFSVISHSLKSLWLRTINSSTLQELKIEGKKKMNLSKMNEKFKDFRCWPSENFLDVISRLFLNLSSKSLLPFKGVEVKISSHQKNIFISKNFPLGSHPRSEEWNLHLLCVHLSLWIYIQIVTRADFTTVPMNVICRRENFSRTQANKEAKKSFLIINHSSLFLSSLSVNKFLML